MLIPVKNKTMNITSKHRHLTSKDIELRLINPTIIDLISEIKIKTNRDIRILDWGCGRGATVAKLSVLGYNAIGVDVDPDVINKATNAFQDIGINAHDKLSLLTKKNKTSIIDNSIDLIITEHVIEHIEDIDSFFAECQRILTRDGIIYSVFPSKYRLVEPHLKMPFVHLAGKNNFSKYLIFFWVALNIKPNWTCKNETSTYHNYLVRKMHYRSISEIENKAAKYNLKLEKITKSNTTFQKIKKKYFKFVPEFMLSYIIFNFYISHVKIRRI